MATPPPADPAVAPDADAPPEAAGPGPDGGPAPAPTDLVLPSAPVDGPQATEAGPAQRVATAPQAPAGAGLPGADGATQMLQAPDVTAAIFVDRSGRRARTLRRVVSAVVLLGLLLIVALWVSQGVQALGLGVPA